MDLVENYCQLAYYKFFIYKLQIQNSWKISSDLFKYTAIFLTSGSALFIYKYLNKSSESIDFDVENTESLSDRRKKGMFRHFSGLPYLVLHSMCHLWNDFLFKIKM